MTIEDCKDKLEVAFYENFLNHGSNGVVTGTDLRRFSEREKFPSGVVEVALGQLITKGTISRIYNVLDQEAKYRMNLSAFETIQTALENDTD